MSELLLIYLILGTATIIFSLSAILAKDLLYAAIFLCGESLLLSVLFFFLRAPDVAITQASIGAALTTALFLLTIKRTERIE